MELNEANIARFLGCACRAEVAYALKGNPTNLAYHLFVCHADHRYRKFIIPKKCGGERIICAPSSGIQYYQRNLADLLSELYEKKAPVHGFVTQRSIKTNAAVHCNKKWVVNIDLHNFFPTIHFGRVRGVFMSAPFGFNQITATTLAQICCHKGSLPQGAPSSPIVSNFVCRRLDNELQAFAIRHKLLYTRYADDITFSTNLTEIPEALGTTDSDHLLFLSDELRKIILQNGFQINEAKVRYACRDNRQDVTGLIVNKKVNIKRTYIRKIRAMLHAWERYGLQAAAHEYFAKYHPHKIIPAYPDLAYEKTLAGMIGFVGQIKGLEDPTYSRFYTKIKQLDRTAQLAMPTYIRDVTPDSVVILCEGKTDGIHLKAAWDYFVRQGEFVDLNLYFHTYPDQVKPSNGALNTYCKTANMNPDKSFRICLFDNDDKRFVFSDENHPYQYWGNNTYSCNLPQPQHRNFKEVCIEFFYTDEDLAIKDTKKRRIYISTEFDPDTTRHKTEMVFCSAKNKLNDKHPKILDCSINDANGNNVAISKNDFAQNIAQHKGAFAQVHFEYFRPIFERFESIINAHKERENSNT